MTWAALWRMTASASGSFFVSSRRCTSPEARQRAVQIDLFAVDFGHDRRFGQPSADFLGHVERRNRAVELFSAAIGQNYGKHLRCSELGNLGRNP